MLLSKAELGYLIQSTSKQFGTKSSTGTIVTPNMLKMNEKLEALAFRISSRSMTNFVEHQNSDSKRAFQQPICKVNSENVKYNL
jgi:hypothetical protein